MSAHHYHAHAWGGTQVDAYAGGRAPASALAPSSAEPVQAQWDDTEIPEENFCASISSRTNCQCRAYKVKGEQHCHFHLKTILKAREADTDGADA